MQHPLLVILDESAALDASAEHDLFERYATSAGQENDGITAEADPAARRPAPRLSANRPPRIIQRKNDVWHHGQVTAGRVGPVARRLP